MSKTILIQRFSMEDFQDNVSDLGQDCAEQLTQESLRAFKDDQTTNLCTWSKDASENLSIIRAMINNSMEIIYGCTLLIMAYDSDSETFIDYLTIDSGNPNE